MRSSLNALRRTAGWTGAAILVLSGLAASLVVQAQAPLTLVSTAWPPFTNAAGQPRFALDLVEAALGRIGLKSTTAIVGATQFTPAVLTGKFDGSGAVWKDPERERALIFSQPYLENRLVLVGRNGADVSAKALPALTGKRVAIVDGYSYGYAIELAGPTFVRSSSEEDSLARLLKGSVDYTLMDELVVQYLIANYPKESSARLQIGTTPLLKKELCFAVRRTRPDAESIITRFNAQLRGMIVDRTYHKLLHVDWIRADIDGDGITEYVPRDDRPGPSEPKQAYTLFSPPPQQESQPSTKPSFYVGGNIYSDWASVPENYKDINSQQPDPSRSTASIFKFSW